MVALEKELASEKYQVKKLADRLKHFRSSEFDMKKILNELDNAKVILCVNEIGHLPIFFACHLYLLLYIYIFIIFRCILFALKEVVTEWN